jgi:hypothetical protein
MVQVDIFWSYALGAGYAVAAARQLKNMPESKDQPPDEERAGAPFINRYFVFSLFYAAVFFAPSGIYLLWRFTSWETMHVWGEGISPLLVVVFAITNVTQSILGYWMAWRCVRAGHAYRAYLHFVGAYFCMFFILVHGWDGTGYRRFFSATLADFEAWRPSNVMAWFSSDVAITLYVMGVFLIPPLLYVTAAWLKRGFALDASIDASRGGMGRLVALMLVSVFVCGLGTAVASSLLIHYLGPVFGILVFIAAAYFLLVRKGGLYHAVYRAMTLNKS